MKIIFSIFVLALIVLSCTENIPEVTKEQDLSIFGIWKRDYVERTYANESARNLARQNPRREPKYYYMNIFPDGKGSLLYDTEIDTFTWEKSNTSGDLDTLIGSMFNQNFEIKLLFTGTKTSLQVTTDNGHTNMIFSQEAKVTTDFKEDPFYPDNNAWRIRKGDLLTEEELEYKVNNYLDHYRLLFKAALDSENPRTFSNKNSKGLLLVYKGDIGIIGKEAMTEDWYSYFYNEEEALKAYEMTKEKVRSKRASGEKTDNWLLDNLLILEKMLEVE